MLKFCALSAFEKSSVAMTQKDILKACRAVAAYSDENSLYIDYTICFRVGRTIYGTIPCMEIPFSIR